MVSPLFFPFVSLSSPSLLSLPFSPFPPPPFLTRFYDDKVAEAKDGYWNCPCVPMRERHECHCMLFLTEDSDFSGEETVISYETVVEEARKAGGGEVEEF